VCEPGKEIFGWNLNLREAQLVSLLQLADQITHLD